MVGCRPGGRFGAPSPCCAKDRARHLVKPHCGTSGREGRPDHRDHGHYRRTAKDRWHRRSSLLRLRLRRSLSARPSRGRDRRSRRGSSCVVDGNIFLLELRTNYPLVKTEVFNNLIAAEEGLFSHRCDGLFFDDLPLLYKKNPSLTASRILNSCS